MRTLRAVALLVCLACVVGIPRVDGGDTGLPPILDGLPMPEGLQTLAVNRAGDRAALAILDDPEAKTLRSTVQLHSAGGGEPASVELPGVMRALLFVEPGSVIYGLQYRPARKRDGDTSLVTIDFETLETRRVARLPPASRGLDYWPHENALLIAAHDEIRTVFLPLMRSGPLFNILGENLAVVAVNGTRILVGQDLALLDVDLSDPPSRDGFPSRQRIEVPSPVVSLALSADGSRVLAGLADGTIARVTIDPLRLDETGTGVLPSRSAREAVPARVESAPRTSAEPVLDNVTAGPAAGLDDPEQPATHGSFENPPARDDPGPEENPPAARSAAVPAPATSSEPVVDDTSAEPGASPDFPEQPATHGSFEIPPARDDPEADEPPHPVQARGTVSGPASDRVVAVVFLGPNNILREAARAVPSSAGRWEISGLAPGRYRVQLDGGGSRVLVAEPRILVLDIAEDRATVTAEFNVLGTR